jgi:adenosylcobyric acid synthase
MTSGQGVRRRPLMVVGCTSSAGKSLLVTALARWFARQGIDVAPFKAQNMSNNARVVEGGEIGLAQWLQALAAGASPSTDMNPVLLKPEADTRSQVVVQGSVRHDLTSMPWRERGPHLWPAMQESFDRLHDAHELILIEGAGSPAEINLQDLVNNRVMDHADAAALLVVDIDRGGAFAHLYGTWSLVPHATRARLRGYVLNKFRGDPSLIEPGPELLHELTGLALAGIVPMTTHDLPDEEGASLRASTHEGGLVVGIVRYPCASNLDEFHLIGHAARVRWISGPQDIQGCDVVILPGSKHVSADLAWLRSRRIDVALIDRARSDGRIMGICGGCMMLGHDIADAEGIEGSAIGMGLLDLKTTFEATKVTRLVNVETPDLPAHWSGISRLATTGYEIRHGRIKGGDCEITSQFWAAGSILGTSLHGLLEDPTVVAALLGTRPEATLEDTFEALADVIEERLDHRLLWDMVCRPG